MQTWGRYCFLLLGTCASFHFILQYTHQGYSGSTSILALSQHIRSEWRSWNFHQVEYDWYFEANATLSLEPRANATFVILARNSDLEGTIQSVRNIERRFNARRGYPYVFLNEVPFSDEFKRRVSAASGSHMEFGLIPREHWYQPEWIDEERATEGRNKLELEKIVYGGSVPRVTCWFTLLYCSSWYRNMCRYNSGFFFRHDLMQKYRWYWRIEPDVKFLCDITFDPFIFMRDNDKLYGFTISIREFEQTVPSLWGHVRDFVALHPEYIAVENAMSFLSDDEGKSYNLCHFWSNFEIADMHFWQGPAYTAFFEHLDSTGGFYYERWGDAPVHSIAAALFARKDQVHFFEDIGYQHKPFTHCPWRGETRRKGNCSCPPIIIDFHGNSCLKLWNRISTLEG